MGSEPHKLNHHPHEGRRRWPRYSSDVPVKVLIDGPQDPLVIDGRCTKMSAGGMCFFALGNFTPGAQIGLEFISPDSGQPARVRGTIRNRTVYLYGVEYEAAGGMS
jgi:PilZ domain